MPPVYRSAPAGAINRPDGQPPRLLDRLRSALRAKHHAWRTEQAYVDWVRRYILYHGRRHPQEMGGPEIEAYLTHLAVASRVSASTQTQALCVILFLYKHVLRIDLPQLDAVRAKRPKRLPVVLSYSRGACGVQSPLDALGNSGRELTVGLRRSRVAHAAGSRQTSEWMKVGIQGDTQLRRGNHSTCSAVRVD